MLKEVIVEEEVCDFCKTSLYDVKCSQCGKAFCWKCLDNQKEKPQVVAFKCGNALESEDMSRICPDCYQKIHPDIIALLQEMSDHEKERENVRNKFEKESIILNKRMDELLALHNVKGQS